jgi:hypothetical protein
MSNKPEIIMAFDLDLRSELGLAILVVTSLPVLVKMYRVENCALWS